MELAETTMTETLQQGWDLTEIYPDDGAWREAVQAAEGLVAKLAAFKGGLGTASRLADFFEAREDLLTLQSRVGTYPMLHLALAPNDAHWLGLAAEVQAEGQRTQQALGFWEEELAALEPGTLPGWAGSEPRLERYLNLLERFDQRARHRLGAEREEMLLKLAPVIGLPRGIRDAVNRGIDFPAVDGKPLSVMAYASEFVRSPDPAVRAAAAAAVRKGLDPHIPALAAALGASILRDVTVARLRGFERGADLYLASQGLGAEHADAVVEGIFQDVAPHVQRLAELKRRVLGLDELHLHDISAPLDGDDNPALEYGAAWDLLLAALAPEGPAASSLLETARDKRWVEPRGPAAGGAMPFCAAVIGLHPFLMGPWRGRLSDMFVTAHELGHAVHFALASEAQPPSLLYADAAFFVEVPSRVHELLLGRHLSSNTDLGWRAAALQLDGLNGSLAATAMLAALERDLYAICESGRQITLDDITRSHVSSLRRLFGDVLVLDPHAEASWAMWPHVFAPTYPVAYPAGMCCAAIVLESLTSGDAAGSARWTDTLRLGGSVSARELMVAAGLDLGAPGIAQPFARFYGGLVDLVEAGVD